MKKIVSYSIFRAPGTNPLYWRSDGTPDVVSTYMRYLPTLVRAHHAIWSGWELRLHHDAAVMAHPYYGALVRMQDRGLIQLRDCGQSWALCESMMWRMLPVFEEEDCVLVCYDVDSLPLLRLRRMAEALLSASDRSVSVFHACESHDGVMGGGISVKAARFRELTGASSFSEFKGLDGAKDWGVYASDEDYLRRVIWPRVAGEAIVWRHNTQTVLPGANDIRWVDQLPPTPSDVHPVVAEGGDWYAPYLGSAGYELERAFAFYAGVDLPVMSAISECEEA